MEAQMTKRVNSDGIEKIVGAKRDDRFHIGRAFSEKKEFYILHSARCLTMHEDINQCPFSLALDKDIEFDTWAGFLDRPVALSIEGDRLSPWKALG